MAMIFVYDHTVGGFRCGTGEPLPVLLREHAFSRRQGYGGPAWTDRRLVRAYQAACAELGPIEVEACFKRPGRGQSAHYAGLALDMGRELPPYRRRELREFCLASPLFAYVEPPYLTPTWVHAEVSVAPACGPGRGYPFLAPGDAGPHVFLLQELLNQRGFPCLMTGRFSETTRLALLRYQRRHGLPAHGHADGELWGHITS